MTALQELIEIINKSLIHTIKPFFNKSGFLLYITLSTFYLPLYILILYNIYNNILTYIINNYYIIYLLYYILWQINFLPKINLPPNIKITTNS